MKVWFAVLLLCWIATAAFAWDKEDYEIFDLVTAVEKDEGPGTTFYSWLEVPPTASTNEIAKSYRKKSMLIHPDKNPGVKGIQERFARMGVVQTILRSPEGRERYDFWLKNGIPKWRGTGYYYSRFRPGLGTVLTFLALLSCLLQNMVQRMNYKRDTERMETIIKKARLSAWGPNLKKTESARKVRVNIASNYDEDEGPGPAKMIDVLVEGDHVYLLDPSGERLPLDVTTIDKPTFSRTWLPAIILSFYRKAVPPKPVQAPANGTSKDQDLGDSTEQDETDGDASDMLGASGVESKDRIAALKAGGKKKKLKRR